ncbi:MAG: YmaF family protein [Peptococcaceae bacterium]|nr:YmaF family protein [Peptococcaceae bacterium]
MSQHVHIFSARILSGHLHFYSGLSGPADGEDPAHIHPVKATTTAGGDHEHAINLETGPPLPTGAGHVHPIAGVTGENGEPPHADRLQDLTGPSLPLR